MSQSKLLSRDQWYACGRVVCVPNEEARDVVNFWEGQAVALKRGAWHVFSEDQTVPVQQVYEGAVAA